MAKVTVKKRSDLNIKVKLARDMIRRGKHVESAAKRRIGQAPRRVDTGRLRASIHTSLIIFSGLPAVRVGSPVEYALFVHDGTIYMKANPYLKDALPAFRL